MASDLSRQIHSINIGEKENGAWKTSTLKNTWDTYHLVPSSRPVVNPPEVRTMYVDVPGVDGVIDLTTSLTGDVLYKNREGSWDFVVANDYEDWTAIYHKLMNEIHGKKWLVSLQDDPNYYYKGRLSVNEWKSERNWSKITLDYHFEPYKYEFNTGNEPWLWDPFSFETGYIRNYGGPEVIVNSDNTITEVPPITEGGYTVMGPLIVDGDDSLTIEYQDIRTERPIPTIIYVYQGSTNVTVKLGGGSTAYPLETGKLNNLTTILAADLIDPRFGYIGREGRTFVFSGHGSVYIKFQGGWL